jgi:hexosaminidase
MGNRSVWIAVPESIEVFVSDDGMNFRAAGKSMSEVYEQEASMVYFPIRVNVNEEARYVRVLARKKSGGLSAYMFTDEIIIN